MITGTLCIFYNMHTGFSGGYFVQDLLFLLYNFTSYGFYTCFEVNISKHYYQNDESKLPFHMSEAYAYVRDHYMKSMMKHFFYFSFFMYYGGCAAYYVIFYSLQDSISGVGQVQSLWTVGFALQISLVVFANTLINTQIRDHNAVMVGSHMFILLQLPFTFYLINEVKREALWHDIPEVLQNSTFYLAIFLTVWMLMLPFMLWRRCKRLVYSDHPY